MTERLENFDFSGDEAHLALVHKDQGGAANGYKTIVTKSTKRVKKAQTVTIEMDLPAFLQKFFFIYEEDAKALAYLLGYKKPELEDGLEQVLDYNEWLSDNALMIKLNSPETISQDDLQEVATIEQGINELYATVASSTIQVMKSKFKDVESEIHVMKAAVEAKDRELILTKKSLDDANISIENLSSQLYTYRMNEKEMLMNSRKESLQKALGIFDQQLFDSIKDLSDESFSTVIKALRPTVDSSLFVQKSKHVSPVESDPLMAAIERLNKQQGVF